MEEEGVGASSGTESRATLAGRGDPPLPRTIWYMGVKARVIPGFLGRVLEEEVPPGGTVVDLMSGSGVVAVYCAHRYRVIANDVQDYAAVIARAFIAHDPEEKAAFLGSVDPVKDLGESYDANLQRLAAAFAPALAVEDVFLRLHERGENGLDWCAGYRSVLGDPDALHLPAAAKMISEEALAACRADPRLRPARLATAYYANVYFGLRQCLVIDSLRAAIEDMDTRLPHAARKRVHYLSALLHAASISTSGTSHFAQPRHLTKDSELRAMAKRRLIDIRALFERFSGEILATVRRTEHVRGNIVLSNDCESLMEEADGVSRFRFTPPVDLVYLDPPYTADHYSRFYHVLEVLSRYDYPTLELDPRGGCLRGRYPALSSRYQSDFSRPVKVEDAFRQVIRAASGSGAKLVVSYASPSGLLLKQYARRCPGKDPVNLLEDLCLEGYEDVHTLRKPMLHSGQGEGGLRVNELLVVCRGPRGRRSPPRA